VNREEILQTAINLTMGDRNEQNGNPLENHLRIAKIWSVILDKEIEPYQVALCMAGLEIGSPCLSIHWMTSFIDGAAYLSDCRGNQATRPSNRAEIALLKPF
jgi:hypothetical protein